MLSSCVACMQLVTKQMKKLMIYACFCNKHELVFGCPFVQTKTEWFIHSNTK